MKDIKSMMIGFLLATCMFLFMGQGNNNSQIGRYQSYESPHHDFNILLVDTTNGQIHIVDWGKHEHGPNAKENVWIPYIAGGFKAN